MRYGEVPGAETPPEAKNRVMHAMLHIGPAGVIMISDTSPNETVSNGRNVWVALHFDEPSSMDKLFDALAKGGKVVMPLGDTFWGAKFGMLEDPFGISWMFNCQLEKAK